MQEVGIERLQKQVRAAGIPLEHPKGPLSYDKDKKTSTSGNSPDDVVKELFARVDKDGLEIRMGCSTPQLEVAL